MAGFPDVVAGLLMTVRRSRSYKVGFTGFDSKVKIGYSQIFTCDSDVVTAGYGDIKDVVRGVLAEFSFRI